MRSTAEAVDASLPAEHPEARGVRRILANGLALLVAYLLPRAFTFAAVVVAARVLGAGDFGAYGTAAAYAVILSIVATLGMAPLLVREMARDPGRAPGLLRAAHLVKTGSNVVMLAALVLMARAVFAFDDQVTRAALLLGAGYALGAYAENLAAYFQAVERMHVWTQASAIFGLVSGLLGGVIVLTTGDLVAFCTAPAAGWAAALLWLLFRAPPDVRRGAPVQGSDVAALLRSLAPFAAAFVFLTVYYKIDVLLLARWRSREKVGIYTAAYKFVDIFQALVIVATTAVYPRLSRAAAARDAPGRWAGSRSTELLLLAAVPMGLALNLLAAPVIELLFGSGYEASVGVLRLLALVLPFLAVTIHAGYVLAASERMLPVAALYLAGVGLNVVLNQALIPRRGAEGAALAMLGSEAALAVGFVVVLRAAASTVPSVRVVATAFVAVGLGLATWMLPDPSGGFLRALALVTGLTVLYPATGAFGSDDVSLLRSALRRPGSRSDGRASS